MSEQRFPPEMIFAGLKKNNPDFDAKYEIRSAAEKLFSEVKKNNPDFDAKKYDHLIYLYEKEGFTRAEATVDEMMIFCEAGRILKKSMEKDQCSPQSA